MTRHLCVSVTLLDPLFHGKGDDDEPEWPPSPMRLFQALVAGSRIGCRNAEWSDANAEAFRWLERREAPLIIGPAARRTAAHTLFVPNNDADKKFDRQERLTSKIVQPHRMVNGVFETEAAQTLHYLWAIAASEWAEARLHAELLCREARKLVALGWGIDQAVADGRILTDAEARSLHGWRWRAWHTHRPGQRMMRVPMANSLNDLGQVYTSFVNRIDGKRFNPPRQLTRFDSVVYLSAAALPPRHYAIFELPEGVAFRQEDTVAVAAMLRSLACRCAKTDSHEFPGGPERYVAGHIRDDPSLRNGATPPRFSYLPLPTIGHEHADGMIRRVLIAESFGADGEHARWAQQRLRNQVLRDHDSRERGVLLDLWRRSSNEMLDRYVEEHNRWSSVTPVILPGFDDGKRAKAERLFLQAVRQAGLPGDCIIDFTLRKAPFWPGAQHPDCYRRPDYLDSAKNRRFSAWHVHLLLLERMAGPISIGAGRHCGLGVLAAFSGQSSPPLRRRERQLE